MRKYAIALYLFLIGGILVGAGAFYKESHATWSTCFLVVGYTVDLAAVYFVLRTALKK
ncbi:MAG: hypothetical protein ACSHWW_05315 [Nonlabens sp.]|uniref:hypothetical protein n=1 Tax=Nonlabens sp. TaxID=1888209 RepID=UPI003EF8FFBA